MSYVENKDKLPLFLAGIPAALSAAFGIASATAENPQIKEALSCGPLAVVAGTACVALGFIMGRQSAERAEPVRIASKLKTP